MLDHWTVWLDAQAPLLAWIGGISFALLLSSIIAAPWLVARLPADYLLEEPSTRIHSGTAALLVGILRNTVAVVLLIVGLLMLVAPGPGIVMLLLSLSISRIPGKHRIIRRLASRHSVFESLNWMRKRHGKAPFIKPCSKS